MQFAALTALGEVVELAVLDVLVDRPGDIQHTQGLVNGFFLEQALQLFHVVGNVKRNAHAVDVLDRLRVFRAFELPRALQRDEFLCGKRGQLVRHAYGRRVFQFRVVRAH